MMKDYCLLTMSVHEIALNTQWFSVGPVKRCLLYACSLGIQFRKVQSNSNLSVANMQEVVAIISSNVAKFVFKHFRVPNFQLPICVILYCIIMMQVWKIIIRVPFSLVRCGCNFCYNCGENWKFGHISKRGFEFYN